MKGDVFIQNKRQYKLNKTLEIFTWFGFFSSSVGTLEKAMCT